MKKKSCLIFFGLFLFALFTPCYIYAEATINTEGELRLFSTAMLQDYEEGLFPHTAGEFGMIKGDARIKFHGYVTDQASYFVRTDFIYTNPSEVQSLQDTEGIAWEAVSPLKIVLFEGYFAIADLGLDGLDLKLGKQRIKWGTADKLHVVDNLNPNDFANFFTFDPDYFGEKIPGTGALLTYTYDDWRLEFAYLFSHTPASFPTGYWGKVEAGFEYALQEKYGISNPIQTSLEIDETSVDTAPFAFRFSKFVGNIDLGLSYYNGYMDVPVLKEVLIPFQEESLSVELSYFYPKLQVVGVDIAGELFTVGYWMEAAYFKPEDAKGSIVLSDNSGGSMVQEAQLFENYYLKYTVGIDYTFGIGEGIYVNFQYNHGFYDEIDYHDEAEEMLGLGQPGLMSELEDYFAGDIKYTLMRWDLTLELFFLLEVADFDDFKNKSALAIFPSVSFKPTDGTNIEVGTVIGQTKGDPFDTKFGMLDQSALVYFLAELYF